MNVYKQIWMEEVALLTLGKAMKDDPVMSHTNAGHQTVKQMVGTGAVRTSGVIATSALIAWADGPLPVGDIIAAGVLATYGAYLLLS